MGLLDTRGGKTFRVLYINPDGREYWLTLIAIGAFGTDPPFVVHELPDETFEAAEVRYSNLYEFASAHGCYYDGRLESVDVVN